MLKSLQLPQWPFCHNRNNFPAKFSAFWIGSTLVYPSLTLPSANKQTNKQTNKQILHSYLKQIFLLCLPSFLLLYRPSLLLWLPFIPALSQSVWYSRWTGRTLPDLICHAFCTILPCSSLIIWADPWNNLFTSSLVTQKEASDTHAYKAVDVRLYMENFYSCREREQTTQIKELLYSHIRRTSCLVDF